MVEPTLPSVDAECQTDKKKNFSKESISCDQLKKLLNYDAETGIFIWRVHISPFVVAGSRAGGKDKNGYICIKINNRMYKAHRLAWLYVYGQWPEHDIDHKDGVPYNNRLINLRSATRSENRQNLSANSNNKSGMLGVYWHKQHLKWCVQIKINKKSKHIGLFDDLQAAAQAYLDSKRELHPFQPIPRR